MNTTLQRALGRHAPSALWREATMVRQEIFGVERLEQHARSLAAAQVISDRPPAVLSLRDRLDDDASALLAAYRASAAQLERGVEIAPAAVWLLDNYHVVEELLRSVRDGLPASYYRELPKLAEGPFAGYPRAFGVAWAYVAHGDSHLDPEVLRRFVVAYQSVQPLTIGELWAIPLMLRLVLIENLRRLADLISDEHAQRADADAFAAALLTPGRTRQELDAEIDRRPPGRLPMHFAAQLARRLRDLDPETMPAVRWLEERLAEQGETVEQVVQDAQQFQGGANVTVRNIVTSMRLLSSLDWAELFESVSLVDQKLRDASDFAAMDLPTRDRYRRAVEALARRSPFTELEVTDHALHAARVAAARPADQLEAERRSAGAPADQLEAERVADPGYHLIGRGRRALERSLGFRPTFGTRLRRLAAGVGVTGYAAVIMIASLFTLLIAIWVFAATGVGAGLLALFALLALVPATEVATSIVNRCVAWFAQALPIPALELKSGVPSELRTMVVVPTLLSSEAELLEQLERLEVHYLASGSGDVTFALLSDGVDADREVVPSDAALLAVAEDAVSALNRRHGPGPSGDRFLVLHRRRVFNPSEGRWMGWERKRGKLHELNRLLRGARDTSFMPVGSRRPQVPSGVRYVITLDADTQLPRDAASRLIGKMAHPLNRPRFCPERQRVIDGYGIMQPRVTPALPIGAERSFFQRLFSTEGGIDPYASAVSDVYQDLFGEGSFTGKGIYDIDAFETALAGRIPENTLLSHDLFEGVYARAGLASDVEVIEDFPSRYDVAVKRQHRWTRGDWQLLPWVLRPGRGRAALPALGRWKMLDNLRRSLLAPATVAGFVVSWLLPQPAGMVAALLLLASIAAPLVLPSVTASRPRRADVRLRHQALRFLGDIWQAVVQTLLSFVFLADRAWSELDAIVRTLFRLYVTRRKLLEWTTAAHAASRPQRGVLGYYRQMAGGTLLALALGLVALAIAPGNWSLIMPIVLAWTSAPAIAWWASRPARARRRRVLSVAEAIDLRLIARRTWRFFETFVTREHHMLPPDNFQEDPEPVVAARTSPTNIGLYLLSAVAARDFGWAGTVATAERLEAAFETIRRLPRFEGHLYNWYDTRTLRVLEPAYVSSVDSGNVAGHLIALANACEEWIDAPLADAAGEGVADAVRLARGALAALPEADLASGHELARLLDESLAELRSAAPVHDGWPRSLEPLLERASEAASDLARVVGEAAASELTYWTAAARAALEQHEADRRVDAEGIDILRARFRDLAEEARSLALAMDFAFLTDQERNLLSIGYSVAERRLDPGCYDLLASEARLASLVAVAKGDLPTRHWFRLGRNATAVGRGSALVSWSGSMFEYLMPPLVMHAPAGSLLEQTHRLVVERQRRYGRLRGVPWGVSESAYFARDLEFTYQYATFGVPGLGLKRGLGDELVIAPYATGLAAMMDPKASHRNFGHLADLGALGRYGYYEALDFTRSRLPPSERYAIVRAFMAHHQGMTIVAMTNVLCAGAMRERFHREPIIKASELLLQERMPRDVAREHPRAEQVRASVDEAPATPGSVRRLTSSVGGPPVTHLLSNGRYAVMLTAGGAGYSRWNDLAVTRWREDPTRDHWGSFVFLRDVQSGRVWSAGAQPLGDEADDEAIEFTEDGAEFVRRRKTLTTGLTVLVSGEYDGEVRRVVLSNGGTREREIEVTTYAELALTYPAADQAHPAFAKMFVQTEYLAEYGALIATRRRRSPDEPEVWAAHVAMLEGEASAPPQYESDRERFLGRGRSVATATAIVDGGPLSNSVGTVLDPIFSLRYRLRIPPFSVARVNFWTLMARSRAELIDLIDVCSTRGAFERAKTLAWTQAQVQLRHIGVDAAEAADFQRLAAPLLYTHPGFRPSSEAIVRGAGPQSALWPYGISGDLPIVLLRITDLADIAQVRQLLRAHEYWRTKRLVVDLVIVNEHAASYRQDLQVAIDAAVRSSQSRLRVGLDLAQGTVFTLRADRLTAEARDLLQATARVVLVAQRGVITNQLAALRRLRPSPQLERRRRIRSFAPRALSRPLQPPPGARRTQPVPRAATVQPEELEFFNGFGGFADDGREYVTILEGGRTTPAPYVNVIANPAFGFQVSADGSGYTWAENSRENQLTPWSNDPVEDPTGEAFFIRDEETHDLWSPTAQPIRGDGTYVARHGFGYSRFEHEAYGIATHLLQYVPLDAPIKISRLVLHNRTDRTRRLSVTAYAEWVLGTSRAGSAPLMLTEADAQTGALLVSNPWSTAFPGRVGFADLAGEQTAWTVDRSEFLGRGGSLAAPASLLRPAPLSGRTGAGLDPCTALQRGLEIAPGERVEVVALLGHCGSADEARTLLERYRAADLEAVLDEVRAHWRTVLQTVQVTTPERSMDIMLNGWLLYQALACRIWARSGFYQASGAYGFRDQLQDGMALLLARPGEVREHLLRAAGRQFTEGDVQHWWLPHSGQGVRTRISDDRVWLAYATASYVERTGDAAVLDEVVPFLEGPPLESDEHEAFFQPMPADESASLFEHCARGLDQAIELTGERGLPLMGSGDWNDGMNRVGAGGRGESVWLGWFLARTIERFAPFAQRLDPDRAERWERHREALLAALEREAWDGDWYRRATFDDGTWLGSQDSEACRIDAIAQSWAVLSNAADAGRAATAMASLEEHLIRRDEGLALLFTPPFDRGELDPGYIKGYPPGLRENGGQYSHAAMWAILAYCELGDGDRAAALFDLVNPINHARTRAAAQRYRVEPYVVAADVYSVAPNVGRGGWTWYTGSAGWMYRAGLEGILGLRREGAFLVVDPRLPAAWPGFEATVRVASTRYAIRVEAPPAGRRVEWAAELDGTPIEHAPDGVRIALDGESHELLVVLGEPTAQSVV